MLGTASCKPRKIILPRFHVDHFTECALMGKSYKFTLVASCEEMSIIGRSL